VLDALRLADRFLVHTPAEGRPGERVIVGPELDDATAVECFGRFDAGPGGLRMTDAPRA
jgi:hypothetical protein